MILLDTHIWVWWVQNDARMGAATPILDALPPAELAISAISCWEVAVLHSRGRIAFDCQIDEWFEAALHESAVSVVNLTPAIAIASERLPSEIHRDPADRMLVATARVLGCGLLTEDRKLLNYQYVDAFHLGDVSRRHAQ